MCSIHNKLLRKSDRDNNCLQHALHKFRLGKLQRKKMRINISTRHHKNQMSFSCLVIFYFKNHQLDARFSLFVVFFGAYENGNWNKTLSITVSVSTHPSVQRNIVFVLKTIKIVNRFGLASFFEWKFVIFPLFCPVLSCSTILKHIYFDAWKTNNKREILCKMSFW